MENRIRQLREKGGLTQETLAIELEITQQQLSKYERNIASIKVESLKKGKCPIRGCIEISGCCM